ncbi:MAG: hypothetical protein M3R08_11460, partial [Bacteroidota bacterium]|nr:hypothetical protein [Bacteroidota bacterium]
YNGQWYLYPKAIGLEKVLHPEHIILTHGHDDHMHRRSLEMLDKKATVWFPYQWRAGIEGYMHHLGFEQVKEAVTMHTYEVGDDTRITFLAYSLESIVVVESGGLVIVNLNDALNSNHRNVVDMFLRVVKKHWPRIDILISGFSGAGYFPNQIRYPGKDDMEIGKIREHYFAHNLCTFADQLQPKMVVPFAPGFALLEEHNRWINDVKFNRERLPAYHEEHIGPLNDMRYISMWPGDKFEDMEYLPLSPYHDQLRDGGLYHLLDEVYAEEIKEVNTIKPFDRAKILSLKTKAIELMDHNRKLYAKEVLQEVHFSIRFRDVPELVWEVSHPAEGFQVQDLEDVPEGSRIVITTTARLLEISLSRLWGGDALQAYGLVVEMFDQDALDKNLDIVCVRLLCRYPIMREDIRKHPFRAAKYFLTNPSIAALQMKQKVTLRPYVNRFPYNERDHWISTTKCELCNVCQIPVIEYA